MKKIVCIVMAIVLLLTFAIYHKNKSYDFPKDNVYNYMEYRSTIKSILNLKDYVVSAIGMNKALVYDKNKEEIFTLSENVFDNQKNNLFLITSFDNTLIYTSKDDETSGSAIYAFDISTYEKTKITSYNSIVNSKAFLGTQQLLGINMGGNDISSVLHYRGNLFIHQNKLMNVDEVCEIVRKSKGAKDYKIPNMLEKFAVTDEHIFLLSSLNQLLRYDCSTKETVCLSDAKIQDFFIYGSDLFYTPIKNNGVWFKSDFEMNNPEKIFKRAIEFIRIEDGKVFMSDENSKICYINEEMQLVPTDIVIESANIWDTDGKNIILNNTTNQKIDIIPCS